MSGEEYPSSEKSRICPSCRMQISVLAVKCRFCGEEVGKPKEEQRTLSINDLGGEIIHHRAPSGSVMEALEAFRVEDGLDGAAQPSDQDGPAIPSVGPDGMPVLNEEQFGSTYDSGPSSITSVHARRPVTFLERFRTIGLAVGVLLLVIFLAVQAPAWLSKYRESDADAIEPTFENAAPGILARGGSPVAALEAAMAAVAHEDSAQNRRIAEDALAAVITAVRRLLNASPFDENNLTDASGMTNRASRLYPNEKTQDLVQEMRAERAAYRMSLIGIDSETKTATFQPNKPGSKAIMVKSGDMLAARFRVKSVGERFVILNDLIRHGRVVTFETGGGIRKQ